jgi:aspartate 1-decarboxylase
MKRTFLKSKLHRATVTESDLAYEGSISIDTKLCEAAGLKPFERVEIYNCNNGERFATYVIPGDDGQICINGAAARLVQPRDLVIICCYVDLEEIEIETHVPTLVFLDEKNKPLNDAHKLPFAGRKSPTSLDN